VGQLDVREAAELCVLHAPMVMASNKCCDEYNTHFRDPYSDC
jgi:hypothetical protein